MLIKLKRRFRMKLKHRYCFGLVVDDTSELSHTKQSTFISKSLIQEEEEEEVKEGKTNERFLTLLDFEKM